MAQLFGRLNNLFETKKLSELEIGKKYKANNFQLIDTQYGKKISILLHDKFKSFLPDRYTKSIEKSDLKSRNEKSVPVNITYNGLDEIKNEFPKKYITKRELVLKFMVAYCGSLWIGALYSMVQMSQLLGETSHVKKYSELLDKAKIAFYKNLWNGQYYNYDCSKTVQQTAIMAGQLVGLWFLRASGVKEEVLPSNHVQSVLQTIYRMNVKSYCGGKMGAVNGMMPDGKVVRTSMQSEEVWIGVVYALAAFMIHEGMIEEGFTTAKGVYETVYNRIGLGFATPEALNDHNVYRSVGYMRPLSIWAMQTAWETSKRR